MTALTQGNYLDINGMVGKLDFEGHYKDLGVSLLCRWDNSYLDEIGRMGWGWFNFCVK